MPGEKQQPNPPVVSIIGRSNSGKTTFLEKLIPELRGRGYRVGAIKHDAHSFEIDHEGKDSYRLKHAGSEAVMISSSSQMAYVKDTASNLPLEELVSSFFGDMDIVLAEGFKDENPNKIEISRQERNEGLMCETYGCIALIADWKPDVDGLPLFHIDDITGVADFIEERFLR